MRTKITSEADNWCRIEFEDRSGDVVRMSLFAPFDGGYVRMKNGSGDRQICEKLASRGATMLWNKQAHPTLADYVRAEYRRMRAAERRESMQGW